jgi:hypothetical protein
VQRPEVVDVLARGKVVVQPGRVRQNTQVRARSRRLTKNVDAMRALPLSGVNTPYIMRRQVDLPAPLGPSKPVISPSRAAKDTWFTASI